MVNADRKPYEPHEPYEPNKPYELNETKSIRRLVCPTPVYAVGIS